MNSQLTDPPVNNDGTLPSGRGRVPEPVVKDCPHHCLLATTRSKHQQLAIVNHTRLLKRSKT